MFFTHAASIFREPGRGAAAATDRHQEKDFQRPPLRHPTDDQHAFSDKIENSNRGAGAETDIDQSGRTFTSHNLPMEWKSSATAPYDRDLELTIIDSSGIHSLVFPCRRRLDGWINARAESRLC